MTDSPPSDHSHAARLNRLLSILSRLKWQQGEDGLVRPVGPADALNDLGIYMLAHEIDMALARQDGSRAPSPFNPSAAEPVRGTASTPPR